MPELGGVSHQDAEYGRVQVQVQVAVDVVERQPGSAELLKLRVDFPPQLLAQAALEEIAEPGAGRVVAEFPSRVHQSRNLFGVAGPNGRTAESDAVRRPASDSRGQGPRLPHKAGSFTIRLAVVRILPDGRG